MCRQGKNLPKEISVMALNITEPTNHIILMTFKHYMNTAITGSQKGDLRKSYKTIELL